MDKLTMFKDSPELKGMEKSKASKIKAVFAPMVNMLEDFENSFNSLIAESEKGMTADIAERAGIMGKQIGKIRIATEDERKAQKEESLREGKAIDGVSNILKWAIADKEDKLKELKHHFILLEKKKLQDLQLDRAKKLSPYVAVAHEMNLADMDDDVWNIYFKGKKTEFKDRQEAEKVAEANRIKKEKEAKKEQERVRKENIKLKAEADERDRLKKIEDEKRAKIESDRVKKEKEKTDKYQADLQAERDKNAEIQRIAKVKQDKIEAELQEKKDKEAKDEADRIKAEQNELKKGDAQKVRDLIAELKGICPKYEFKSAKNQKMKEDVTSLISKVIAHIEK